MTQVVRLKSMLMACVAVLSASPALAQDAASQTAIDPRLLVEQLVAEGILTQAQADR